MNKVTTTITNVAMNEEDQSEHDELHQEVRSLARENWNPRHPRVVQIVLEMMNVAARPKAQALEGLITTIGKDQETVIFTRNREEHQMVLDACRRAGRDALELTGESNQLDEWQKQGGILAAIHKSARHGTGMPNARKCIFFSRPPTQREFLQLKARTDRAGLRRSLEEIHLITQGSVDETVAKRVMNPPEPEQR